MGVKVPSTVGRNYEIAWFTCNSNHEGVTCDIFARNAKVVVQLEDGKLGQPLRRVRQAEFGEAYLVG